MCSGLHVYICAWLYLCEFGQGWMAEWHFGSPWRSNLSLSVCPRETWRSQCLDFTPEWALSGSDSPMELQWTHKDSLFATVTAHPHERESQTQTSQRSQISDVFHWIREKKCLRLDLTVLETIFFSFTRSLCFLFYKILTLALSSVKRLLVSDTKLLLTLRPTPHSWVPQVTWQSLIHQGTRLFLTTLMGWET